MQGDGACDDRARTGVLTKRHANMLNDGRVPTIHTIFCTPKLSIQFENDDSRGIVATHDVAEGEVLLVEHCQVNGLDVLLNTVQNNEAWFNELWPRTDSHWSYEAVRSGALTQPAEEKTWNNAFHTNTDDICMLGRMVSAFNHDDRPNTALLPFNIPEPVLEAPTVIVACVAIREIAAGSAMTIQYTQEPTSIHPYIMSTDRVKCPESPLATRLVEAYLETTEYQRVIRHQECAQRGLFTGFAGEAIDLDRNRKYRTSKYMASLQRFWANGFRL